MKYYYVIKLPSYTNHEDNINVHTEVSQKNIYKKVIICE